MGFSFHDAPGPGKVKSCSRMVNEILASAACAQRETGKGVSGPSGVSAGRPWAASPGQGRATCSLEVGYDGRPLGGWGGRVRCSSP